MTDLSTSIKLFASLNRAPGATWIEATKRKAPHKPLLLLAVLDLVHRGVITAPFIAVTGDLAIWRNYGDSLLEFISTLSCTVQYYIQPA